MDMLERIQLIGMIHLPALPGAPGYGGSRERIRARALHDAEALAEAGFDALLLENFGDTPFAKDNAGRHVVAGMTAIAVEIRRQYQLPLGIQVLRNDAMASLAVAAAADADFVRINVLSGVMVTDQGLIEGPAHDVQRYRGAIDAGTIAILADVHVKHAMPLAGDSFEAAVRDTVERGGADAVVITGSGTGVAVDADRLKAAATLTDVPVYAGSGANCESLPWLLSQAHGVIVGTSIKIDGKSHEAVDAQRARRFVQIARDVLDSA
jgi:uncharacterized protein